MAQHTGPQGTHCDYKDADQILHHTFTASDGTIHTATEEEFKLYTAVPPNFVLTRPDISSLWLVKQPYGTFLLHQAGITAAAVYFNKPVSANVVANMSVAVNNAPYFKDQARERKILEHNRSRVLHVRSILMGYSEEYAETLRKIAGESSVRPLGDRENKELEVIWRWHRKCEAALRLLSPLDANIVKEWESHYLFTRKLHIVARERKWKPHPSIAHEEGRGGRWMHVFLGLCVTRAPAAPEQAMWPTEERLFVPAGLATYKRLAIESGLWEAQ